MASKINSMASVELELGVLNLQGGRTKSKWRNLAREVFSATNERDIKKGIIMVNETWLVNDEIPPKLAGYEWIGSNREGKTGKHAKAGVGISVPTKLGQIISSEKDRDFLMMRMEIESTKWLFISMYVSHERGKFNAQLYERITEVLDRNCGENTHVVIGGDMNAHITQFSDEENARGFLLKNFVSQNGLIIVNTSEKCEGKFTRNKAVIDYVLCNGMAYEKLTHMKVDELREKTRISDHNLINLSFNIEARGKISKSPRKQTINIIDKNKASMMTKSMLWGLMRRNKPITYEEFRDSIQANIEASKKRIRVDKTYPVQSREISQLLKEKRLLSRDWRKARMKGDGIKEQQIALEFKSMQLKIYEEVEAEVARQNKKWYDHIMRNSREQRAMRFWEYTRRKERNPREMVRPIDDTGREILDDEMGEHLTSVLKTLFECENVETEVHEPNQTSSLHVQTEIDLHLDTETIEKTFGKMSNDSAMGYDNIPTYVIKSVGIVGYEFIAQLFTQIAKGTSPIPEEWRKGRVSLLPKPTSEKRRLSTYRPLTISSVLYRTFARIVCKEIQNWMESTGTIGEMQFGFRKDRRGEDCMFILTSAIEIARHEKTGLITCFLDCTKAYDRIDRNRLWRVLEEKNMPKPILELIKLLYTDNEVTLQYGEHKSKPIKTEKGLRQGCPLSPILFILYISGLEERIKRTGAGFEVRLPGNIFNLRQKKSFPIGGILFADDLVLIGRSRREMEILLDVTSKFGDDMNLHFNPAKSGIVEFAKCADSERTYEIQHRQLPVLKTYKYLGITLCDKNNYLEEQEKIWTAKAERVLRQMHAKSLWKFNRFEVTKIQWKSTAVPTLTYANSVTTMSSKLRRRLETLQREAGRWALGQPNANTAIEFIDGELGWSTFEAREAKSKLTYSARIGEMSELRWPKAISTMMRIANIPSRLRNRCRELQTKYGCQEIRELPRNTNRVTLGVYKKYVDTTIKAKLDEAWHDGMSEKKTLDRYRHFKKVRGIIEHIYDNTKGSRLLANARAGCLQTRKYRSRYKNMEATCRKCGTEEETL